MGTITTLKKKIEQTAANYTAMEEKFQFHRNEHENMGRLIQTMDRVFKAKKSRIAGGEQQWTKYMKGEKPENVSKSEAQNIESAIEYLKKLFNLINKHAEHQRLATYYQSAKDLEYQNLCKQTKMLNEYIHKKDVFKDGTAKGKIDLAKLRKATKQAISTMA